MSRRIVPLRLIVDGMSCNHCEKTIESAVGSLDGVTKVTASAPLSEVMVYHDPERVGREGIAAAITAAGYSVREDTAAAQATAQTVAPGHHPAGAADAETARKTDAARPTAVYRFLGFLAIVAAAYLIIRFSGGATFLPQVTSSMGYGLLFVVGLLTSLHCIAMCGGIVLSQGISREAGDAAPAACPPRPGLKSRLLPSLLYNGGRVVSYTLIGGVVGALGSLFSLSSALKGVMPVIAGAFMLFLGVRMLGIFPWLSRLKVRLPGISGGKVARAAAGRGPFVVGLLNGLMPCGPLQTMQVYALGTGSFFAGAISMFVFSAGTVPLLLGFGAISSLLSAKFNRRMLKASGALVMVLGIVMFARGMNLFGVGLPSLVPPRAASSSAAVATVAGGVQTVRITIGANEYRPFVVQAGVPVRWTINVAAADLNGCNGTVTIPQYGIRKVLVPGDNLVEFTPTQPGSITYTCWMGMIRSTISVVPDVTRIAKGDLAAPPGPSYTTPGGQQGQAGGCCGVTPPRFAGGAIPTDTIQVARMQDGSQVADITVDDQGYSPAVIVMKRGVKGRIRFTPGRLSACNGVVSFPEYQGSLDLSKGQLETPLLDVTADFSFQCGMGMLHGYVKVVDDTTKVDLAAVRKSVAAFRPPAGSGGCCGK